MTNEPNNDTTPTMSRRELYRIIRETQDSHSAECVLRQRLLQKIGDETQRPAQHHTMVEYGYVQPIEGESKYETSLPFSLVGANNEIELT